jgi:hypothetical protein
MDASQTALFAFTGSPVIGVFHTLLEGNTGQCVPGSIWPATLECAEDDAVGRPTADATLDAMLIVATTTETAARSVDARWRIASTRAEGATHPFYLVGSTRHLGLSKSCRAWVPSRAPRHLERAIGHLREERSGSDDRNDGNDKMITPRRPSASVTPHKVPISVWIQRF